MRRAFTAVCRRSPACRDARLAVPGRRCAGCSRRCATKPWRGRSLRRRRHADEGRRGRADRWSRWRSARRTRRRSTASSPPRCAPRCAGDRAPLLRLVAEATGGGTDAGPAYDYSEGLDAAVACHDYPQLYDMTSPPGPCARQQYAAALADAPPTRRRTRPFTRRRVRRLRLADARLVHPLAGRARVQPGRAADAAGGLVRRRPGAGAQRRAGLDHDAPPRATWSPRSSRTPGTSWSRNSFHVTAVGDTDDCAVRILRAFVAAPAGAAAHGLRRGRPAGAGARALPGVGRTVGSDRRVAGSPP